MPKNSYVQKEIQSSHLSLQKSKMKSEKRAKIVERSINYKNKLFIVLNHFGKVIPFLLAVSNARSEMFGLFEFIFVRRSFLGVKSSKNIKISDIKFFG